MEFEEVTDGSDLAQKRTVTPQPLSGEDSMRQSVCQYSRVSGLLARCPWFISGLDGVRKRGSKRLNELGGSLTFPEYQR